MRGKGKRKIRYNRIFIITLVTALLVTGAYKNVGDFLTLMIDRPNGDIDTTSSKSDVQATLPINKQEPINFNASSGDLYSPSAILVRLMDQKVAFRTGSEERIYPASLTKIMTAIVVIDNVSSLKESIVLPEKIFSDLNKANASMAGFLPGEKVPAIDLLYGSLLASGADASMSLALHVSDTESDFTKLMNEKGKELGMDNSNFTNVSGLHDDNHYTTVKDIAILLEYALGNETFRQIFTSVSYTTKSTKLHPDGITFYSTMFEKMDSNKFDGGRILGGKTGYTDEAGLCLASLAEKNGTEYILVTAGAVGDHYTEQYHITDAFTVFGEYLNQ
ncbi:MAG: D-alanyl-D-alanine carboxypeptidase [Firmicutes bacterium HGW-Firmicutes-7]|nr:MAG: D-alanyl-D-alanine carboxypeptidase [Firmicutes bacterium HGW-Firmicutes-7]